MRPILKTNGRSNTTLSDASVERLSPTESTISTTSVRRVTFSPFTSIPTPRPRKRQKLYHEPLKHRSNALTQEERQLELRRHAKKQKKLQMLRNLHKAARQKRNHTLMDLVYDHWKKLQNVRDQAVDWMKTTLNYPKQFNSLVVIRQNPNKLDKHTTNEYDRADAAYLELLSTPIEKRQAMALNLPTTYMKRPFL